MWIYWCISVHLVFAVLEWKTGRRYPTTDQIVPQNGSWMHRNFQKSTDIGSRIDHG
ncbi:hypothetical protein DPMN_145597 [Dreissena polymorpha]|uniref:Uncharacterized protein n=1 Tax=Dreissena polymorpha TaxID=45954 RepID=A0A9D4FA70_DREPO|nr:hypothetical protein DPMN_145597 [Dreissena polymorpha]